MYQDLYDRANKIIKTYACMKLYGAFRPLNVETDALSVCLEIGFLQLSDDMNATLFPIAFASKH